MADEKTYVCERCGGTYKSDWTDEEALAESRELFGSGSGGSPGWAVVCEDCFKLLMRQRNG